MSLWMHPPKHVLCNFYLGKLKPEICWGISLGMIKDCSFIKTAAAFPLIDYSTNRLIVSAL